MFLGPFNRNHVQMCLACLRWWYGSGTCPPDIELLGGCESLCSCCACAVVGYIPQLAGRNSTASHSKSIWCELLRQQHVALVAVNAHRAANADVSSLLDGVVDAVCMSGSMCSTCMRGCYLGVTRLRYRGCYCWVFWVSAGGAGLRGEGHCAQARGGPGDAPALPRPQESHPHVPGPPPSSHLSLTRAWRRRVGWASW